MRISIRAGERFYFANVSPAWAKRHDNGALISIGLTVGEDLSAASLKKLEQAKRLTEITKDKWNHSGCQSYCVLRGATECRW